MLILELDATSIYISAIFVKLVSPCNIFDIRHNYLPSKILEYIDRQIFSGKSDLKDELIVSVL